MASNPKKSKGRVRMRDVANRCGVSISTVSLVLSGDPRIPEDTARKVLQTIKAMEYRPSVIARSLARRGSRTIGVILPETAFVKNQPFYYQALQGIHSQSQPSGYKLIVEAANPVFLERRYYLRMLKEQSADGMIYLAATMNDAFLDSMEKENYPFVLLGGSNQQSKLISVEGDNVKGAKLAVKHLLSLGHKAIGHITGPDNHSFALDRLNGYKEALQEAGITVKSKWIAQGGYDLKQSESATQALLQQKVTAVFAGNDYMALGAMRAIQASGRKIPDDVAVVGMDDLDLSAWMTPPLTTVRYDIFMMASLAAKFIIKQIQSPLIQKSQVGTLPKPSLIIRASCGGKT